MARSIYKWKWEGTGVVYGRAGEGKTSFALQTARDFAIHGDNPVVMFTEDDPKEVRGLLYGKWPELGRKDAQGVFVRPYVENMSLGDHLQASERAGGRLDLIIPGLVVLDHSDAIRPLRRKPPPPMDFPVLFTLETRPTIQGLKFKAIPAPHMVKYNALMMVEVRGGHATLRKHRTLPVDDVYPIPLPLLPWES